MSLGNICSSLPPLSSLSQSEGESGIIKIGCFNTRGFMSNSDYVRQLLGSLDLLAISEHWLFNYDLHKLSSFHCDFSVYASSSPIIEDNFICAPRNIRGNGGVALFIRKSFTQFVKRLPDFCNERVVTVSVSLSARPLCIIAAYLPARSGCTDPFKESLDFLNGIFLQLSVSHDVIILGDMNADLGVAGGPRASTSVNEQGKILLRYLGRWDFLSVHLHVGPSHSSHTYCSEAHGTLSSIDHILCSRHLLSSFSSCFVADDAPLNLSDHFPVCCSFSTFLPKSGFPAVGQSPISLPILDLTGQRISSSLTLLHFTLSWLSLVSRGFCLMPRTFRLLWRLPLYSNLSLVLFLHPSLLLQKRFCPSNVRISTFVLPGMIS